MAERIHNVHEMMLVFDIFIESGPEIKAKTTPNNEGMVNTI